jgi:hypothetical protein
LVAGLLIVVALLRDRSALFGGAMLLLGSATAAGAVAGLLGADTVLRAGDLSEGAMLLLGIAFLLVGVAALARLEDPLLVGALVAAVGMLLAGPEALRRGDTVFGVVMLVAGPVWLLGGVALLRNRGQSGRPAALVPLKDWLTQR